jgi:potassium-transporting ATPase KdpC subunit
MINRYVFASIRMALVTALVLGVAYPLLVTGLAQLAFPAQANGSLVLTGDGRVVGSALIGQRFTTAGYFHPRPSAAGTAGYDAAASGASNLAPTSRLLIETVKARAAAVAAEDGLAPGSVPVDMVTASGSGLDPDISLANAYAQVPRVAKARGMSEAALRGIVDSSVTGRFLGVLGEPRVNVLLLNMALDSTRP